MDEPTPKPPTKMVIFFDANMPKIDPCEQGCPKNSLILCKHRLRFNASVVYLGKTIVGLSDFRVVQRCFALIQKNKKWHRKNCPLFVLVTKDHDFLDDVKSGYVNELDRETTDITLSFADNCVICGVTRLVVRVLDHEPYGWRKNRDLCCAFTRLNQLWEKVRTP